MKILLISLLITFVFGSYVKNEIIRGKCNEKPYMSGGFKSGKCYHVYENVYIQYIHKQNSALLRTNCTKECVTCSYNIETQYACRTVGSESHNFGFGEFPKPGSTGFKVSSFSSQKCEGSNMNGEGVYVDGVCLKTSKGGIYVARGSASTKVFYDASRKGVVQQNFDDDKCEGTPDEVGFYPVGQCVRIFGSPEGYRAIFSR